jgi:hypothetical protein
MIRDKDNSAGSTPFSLPIFGYGGRFHVVSTETHWNDLKNADVGHLSMHHWAKSVFGSQLNNPTKWVTDHT